MPNGRSVSIASLGLLTIWTVAGSGCAGPQPLSRAIDPKDDQAYRALLADASKTPREAFLSAKAQSLGVTTEEAARRDAALSATSNPFSARHDRATVSRGAVIYSHECMSCHGENADGHGKSLPLAMPSLDFHRSSLRWDITMRGGPANKWFKTIQDGATTHEKLPDGSPVTLQMPAFDQRLSREQTWELVTYLQSLNCDLPSAGQSQ